MHGICLYKLAFDLPSPWRIKPVLAQPNESIRQALDLEAKFPPALSLPMSQIDTSMVAASAVGLVNYRLPKYCAKPDDT